MAQSGLVDPGPPMDPMVQLRNMEQKLVAQLTANPLESLVTLVAAGTVLFYQAEVGINEKVKDPWDAFQYISTSLSVGYATIFPVTPVGKIIGALVMMVGPALSARALDPGHHEAADPTLVDKLDEIVRELRKVRGEP